MKNFVYIEGKLNPVVQTLFIPFPELKVVYKTNGMFILDGKTDARLEDIDQLYMELSKVTNITYADYFSMDTVRH